jgi:hypothetical protein
MKQRHQAIRILGVTFGKTVNKSTITSWRNVTGSICAQAQEIYCRALLLHQRIPAYEHISYGECLVFGTDIITPCRYALTNKHRLVVVSLERKYF